MKNFVTFKCKTGKPGDAVVKVGDKNLGAVQSFQYKIKIGEPAKAIINTILTPAELKVLEKDTEIKFIFDRNYFWANVWELFLVWYYNIKNKVKGNYENII